MLTMILCEENYLKNQKNQKIKGNHSVLTTTVHKQTNWQTVLNEFYRKSLEPVELALCICHFISFHFFSLSTSKRSGRKPITINEVATTNATYDFVCWLFGYIGLSRSNIRTHSQPHSRMAIDATVDASVPAFSTLHSASNNRKRDKRIPFTVRSDYIAHTTWLTQKRRSDRISFRI